MAKLRQVFEEAGQSRLLEEFEAASTVYETEALDPPSEEEPEDDEEADDADDPVDDDDAEGPEDEGDEGDEEGDDEADEVGEDEAGDDEVAEDDAGEDDLPGDEANKAKAKANESKKATSEDTDGKVRGSKGRPGRQESESVEVYSYHLSWLITFPCITHPYRPTHSFLSIVPFWANHVIFFQYTVSLRRGKVVTTRPAESFPALRKYLFRNNSFERVLREEGRKRHEKRVTSRFPPVVFYTPTVLLCLEAWNTFWTSLMNWVDCCDFSKSWWKSWRPMDSGTTSRFQDVSRKVGTRWKGSQNSMHGL